MQEHQQIQQSKKPDTILQKQTTPASPIHVSNPVSIIQRAKINPKSLTYADVMQLQRTIGNRAVGRLLSGIRSSTAQQAPVQREEKPEEKEEELLQGKFESKPEQVTCPSCSSAPVQREKSPEEDEEVQMKPIVQREESKEEEPLQGKFALGLTGTLQAKEEAAPNRTGMPDHLRSGLENLSGIDLSGVRVHYNSPKPARLNALAYTQGQEIHVAPGEERHLPHEGWHAVQQIQGRVKPTIQAKGMSINDDPALESEADVMGEQASTQKSHNRFPAPQGKSVTNEGGLKSLSFASEGLTGPSGARQLRYNVLQRVKVNPAGNFATYVNGTVVNANVTAGVHPDDAEVSTESTYNALSQPVNSYGWANLSGSFVMTGAGVGALPTRYSLSIRSTAMGNNLTRMHLIHHGLGANANNNIDNIVLGHPGFNNFHKNHVENFMGDSMQDNFYSSTGNTSLNAALVAGDAIGIAPPAHANAGQPYVVGNPPTFPASLLDPAIGVLAANNGVPANAHAITTDEDFLDNHVVLWYQVVPVFGLAPGALAVNATNAVMDVYNNHRGVAVVLGEVMPAANIGGGLALLAMCNALAGIFPTALRVKASFYIPDPESIPLGGGATADQLPWRENRIPGRTLNNPSGNPYARIRMQYDGGMGVYTTVIRVRQL